MATQVQLVGGGFQDAEGNPLANGYLTMVLDQDEQVNGTTEVCGGVTVSVPLDDNGNVLTSPPVVVWPNDLLIPVNCYYTITGYASNGQRVWGPNVQQVLSTDGDQFDIGSWIPNQLAYWIPPVPQPYDIIFALPGLVPSQTEFQIMPFTRVITLPGGLSTSRGYCNINPTATSTWTFNHNGVEFASFTISTIGVFTFSGTTQVFQIGDRISIVTPDSPDATLADVAITLAGTRTT